MVLPDRFCGIWWFVLICLSSVVYVNQFYVKWGFDVCLVAVCVFAGGLRDIQNYTAISAFFLESRPPIFGSFATSC